MRLGKTQKAIVAFLSRCGEAGGFICSTTKAPEFAGYYLEEIQRSLDALVRRGVVENVRLQRYRLVDKDPA